MLKRLFLAAAAASLALIPIALSGVTTSGCGGAGGGSGGGAGGGAADAGGDPDLTCDASPPTVTFTQVYADIFAGTSADAGGVTQCTSCHKAGVSDGSDSYGLYNTQAAAFMQVGKVSLYAGSAKTLKVVDPNNLGNSTMWLKVLGKAKSPGGQNLGGQMPLGMAPLSAAQKTELKNWICSGATM